MKKSIFKSVSVIICTLFLLLLTPLIPSQISQALTVGIPVTPTGIIAVSSSYNSINISWSVVNGVSGYGIYRATSSAGPYILLSAPTVARFNNTGLTLNKTYYYKVRSYKMAGTLKVYSGYSAIVSSKPMIATPISVKAVPSSQNSINISWSGVAGATGYGIYRATSSVGPYTLLSAPTMTKFNSSGLTTNSTYYYRVRAYKMVGTVKISSGYSAIVSSKPITTLYTYGNTSGNLTNGGMDVSDGQYIYYSNLNDGYKLYKSKLDGSSKLKISDTSCSSLNIVGDWIYYYNFVYMGKSGIYKMKKDGSSKTQLYSGETMGIAVVNDWVYYLQRNASTEQETDLYKMKTDGTSKTKINLGSGNSFVSYDLHDLVVIGNWVYLELYNKAENKSQLCRVMTDGSTVQKVLSFHTRFFSIEDGWIYYINETYKTINKAKVDGSSEEVIYTLQDSTYLFTINVSNGYVYFSTDKFDSINMIGLYKIKTDGSGFVKLLSGSARFLNIVSNWIYFETPGGSTLTYVDGVFRITSGSSKILKLKTNGSQLLDGN